MRQVLFEVPGLGIKIFGYGLMLFFAFLGSMYIAAWRARREKLDPELVYDMALYVFIGGLIGARGFYVYQYWGERVHGFWEIFEIWKGGIVLYGSILGGTLGFLYYRWRRWFPLLPMLDAIAPALAFGIAIGRIGCFLNGCCYGDACNLPWAVRFPKESPPWASEVARNLIPPDAEHTLWLHPTQLYSTVDGLILFLLLTAYYPLRKRDGQVMGLLLLTYPVTRFLIERLRNDEGVFAFGMTISQVISVGLLAFGVAYWVALSRRPAVRHADGPSSDSMLTEPVGGAT
jgi:phosphatidylglycerol---prolipoprotein diacylglyceryl transferase